MASKSELCGCNFLWVKNYFKKKEKNKQKLMEMRFREQLSPLLSRADIIVITGRNSEVHIVDAMTLIYILYVLGKNAFFAQKEPPFCLGLEIFTCP